MRVRTCTQIIGKIYDGYFQSSTLIPFGGSIEAAGSKITVRTFNFDTSFTPSTCKALRFYKWRLCLNFRAIVEHEGGYRAVSFRGVKGLDTPKCFENLGYEVQQTTKFFRRSYDVLDEEIYDLDFNPS